MKPIPNATVHTVLQNLRALRTEKSMPCHSIAEKLGISVRTYRRMEAGTRAMSLDQFFHLAHILQVQADRLIAQKKYSEPSNLRKVS